MGRTLFFVPITTLVLLSSLMGQRRGPNQESAPPIRTPQYGEQTPARSQTRPITLNGEVMMEDGTRPEKPVEVVLVCHGVVRQRAFTSRGDFSIDVGRSRSLATNDSSVGGGPSDDQFLGPTGVGVSSIEPADNSLDMSGCELRASLVGFSSDAIRLGRRRALDNSDVGDIVLHRLEGVEGTTVSANTSKAPKKAKQAFEKAGKELRKKKAQPSKAAKELEKAVKEFPEFAAAWHLLGELRLVLDDAAGAQKAFKQAIDSDPQFISPYLSLAKFLVGQGQWEDAAQLSDKVIELNPYVTYAYYLSAASNYSLGNLDVAEKSARTVVENQEAPRYPQTYFILGGILARQGKVTPASAEFNHYLEVEPAGPTADQVKQILSAWKEQGLISDEQSKNSP